VADMLGGAQADTPYPGDQADEAVQRVREGRKGGKEGPGGGSGGREGGAGREGGSWPARTRGCAHSDTPQRHQHARLTFHVCACAAAQETDAPSQGRNTGTDEGTDKGTGAVARGQLSFEGGAPHIQLTEEVRPPGSSPLQ
jgi:hypothetical protein